MIWVQGGVAFLLWIALGVVQTRRSNHIRKLAETFPRGSRAILGALLFLVPAMVLIGGLAMIMRQGGFTPSGMTPLAWLAVTLLGLIFVQCQILGMAMLVTLVQPERNDSTDEAVHD